jgi:hypothetical protein
MTKLFQNYYGKVELKKAQYPYDNPHYHAVGERPIDTYYIASNVK